ncbi:MAG: DUF2062 domain-containing protein [Gammaproteobacteria bacterium]|jgi:uncharacterized protein (DUF2062 family)
MPRKFFTRFSHQYRMKKDHPWFLRPFDYVLSHPVYFSASRRGVGGGLWVGLFVGLLPIPGQTVLAVLGALALRVNLPVAAITIWVSNPITFVPIFYLAYKIGATLLGMPIDTIPAEPTMEWLTEEIAVRWKPLMYGSLIMAVSVASTVYLLFSVVWHVLTVQRYRRRHQHSIGSIKGGSSNKRK